MKATLCDICGKQISSAEAYGRVVDSQPLRHTSTEMDLCPAHYTDYKHMRQAWVKRMKNAQDGGME